jgi:antitoxin CcdA
MARPYDHSAPKKPANLSINSDLLARARRLKLNLSAPLERALAEKVQQAERARWLEENRSAIAAANRLADEEGRFAEDYPTL